MRQINQMYKPLMLESANERGKDKGIHNSRSDLGIKYDPYKLYQSVNLTAMEKDYKILKAVRLAGSKDSTDR